ncbi:MAG: hypothetical protein Q4C87_00640 [Actinomycetaceae bacterium]|nr:hypothetical protein [Actinomycetaceae bacterium]
MSVLHSHSSRPWALTALLSAAALSLAACAGGATGGAASGAQSGPASGAGHSDGASSSSNGDAHAESGHADEHAHSGEHAGEAHGSDRFVVTYEGGIKVLDAATLKPVGDFPMSGFLRINAFGDNEHVLVTTEKGFQVLSTGSGGGEAQLTDLLFPAQKAGHVTPHGGTTVLFADGTGDITLIPTNALGESADKTPTALPQVTTIKSEAPHHGVALQLKDGSLLRTIGNPDKRTGALVQDKSGKEIARNEECPGVHGEGAVKDEAIIVGCENGVLIWKDGKFTKVASPDADYGRVGNAYVSEKSAVAVTDYKDDKDAEGYLLHRIGFADTAAGTFDVVDLPEGVEYTWRGIRRDGEGNGWLLGTDGALHRIDVAGKKLGDSIPVIGKWEGPKDWQNPHPALTIDGNVAWVTEPATKTVHRVDLTSGEITKAEIGVVPNEVAFSAHAHQH